MKQTFIKTQDKETADKLLSLGFKLLSQDGSVYTFLNQPPKNFAFSEADKKKIVYSDILSM